MVLTYRNDVGCMWLNAITKQSLSNTQECKVLSWQEYFMSIAIISSLRSKDPSRKVGCCIVDNNNRIVSIKSVTKLL